MADQTLVTVVLPAGLAPGGKLRANLYLSPRLAGAARLSAFADWLDWPALVQAHGLRFTVACGSQKATVAVDTSSLRPDVWREIFTPDTFVSAYPTPDFDQRLIVSYPVRDAYAYLKYAYQAAAANPAFPGIERAFEALLVDLAFRNGRGSTLDATLANLRVQMWRAQQGSDTPPSPPTPQVTVAPPVALAAPDGAATTLTLPAGTRAAAERFALYHRMPPAPGRPPLPHTEAQFAHLLDFHTALTAIYAYPSLARALGLVFEVELSASLCAASPAPAATDYGTLAVSAIQPGWTWHAPPDLNLPATAYWLDSTRFEAAPATPPAAFKARNLVPADVFGGFLMLGAADFQLIGVDLDGGMLNVMSLADNIALGRAGDALEYALPALRSAGVSLIANGRAQQLLQAIRDNQKFNAALASGTSNARAFNARDLVRGYRLDIWSSQTQNWCSLHRRNGEYRFGMQSNIVIRTADEEGFTQLSVAQPADDPTRPVDPVASSAGAPQPGTDLYVHERVTRWNGWSLSAPRPGRPLNRSPDPAQAIDPDPTAQQPVTPFKMVTSFTAQRGSLPRLRFGARYRLRARAVDLAGHSVTLSAATPSRAIAPANGQLLPHLRYEPVPPPVVVLSVLPGPGGSLLQLVIRSHNSAPSLDTAPTGETDERHLAPPRAAVLMVEQHGMLDDAQGHLQGGAATYQMIVQRDDGEFPKIGNTPIAPAAQLSVPYFPDPIARGVALAGLPDAPDTQDGRIASGHLAYAALPDVEPRAGSVTFIGFGNAWPDRLPFLLRLIEGSGKPTWDDAARLLTMRLPKSASATVPASCYTDPADLDLLGVWDWLRQWFEAAEQAAMAQSADAGAAVVDIATTRALITRFVLDGAHPMITPPLTLTFVHAVQQPLGRPAFTRLPITPTPGAPQAVSLANRFSSITAWRSYGSHHAVLLGALQIHWASTAAIDIEAQWEQWIDDVTHPAPQRVKGASHVERIDLNALDGGSALPANGAATRYVATYLPTIDTLWFAAPFEQLQGVVSPTTVTAPVHQLGDTQHRLVRYRAMANSRFEEYFEAGLDFTRTSAPLAVDVPASARPLAPDIAYVVPTFGWERQDTTDLKSDVRLGNGLRVYLNRPWYSSGDGELLGVVLWPQAQPAPDDATRETMKSLITQWGLDPLWDVGAAAALAPVPATWQCTLAARSAQGLSLKETPQAVDVAGHEVGYEPARKLWYCDIAFNNSQAYMPFVRLALARYQPHSITGVELSPVALADFAQLTADRSATLSIDRADPRRARLFVGGLAPNGPTHALIDVSVQTRDASLPGELGWRAPAIGVVEITEDAPAPKQPDAVLWSGTIAFAKRPANGQFRVVVREYEVLQVDAPDTVLSDHPVWGERLVYASILPFDFPNSQQGST